MGRMCSTLTEMAPESSTTVAFHPPSPPPTLHHVKYIQSRVRHHRSKSGKQTLVSVSTVGTHPELDDATLESTVHQQMGEWFGPFDVASWKLLKIFRIPYAQPDQVLDQHHSLFSHFSPAVSTYQFRTPCASGRKDLHLWRSSRQCHLRRSHHSLSYTRRYVCSFVSGALKSGRRAAQAVMDDVMIK